MPWQPPPTEKCTVCAKSVYAAERLEAGKKIFHKLCFKCAVCRMTLTVQNYHQSDGVLFCKKHFQENVVHPNTQVVS
ncbi:pollen-specific protein SF3 [Lingula anatina]|uniref:Pollen-specific protein SF3 n=1 Tax=Lingula anatina TaxID=7574 RepID=A0A1S3IHC0_LINAN|nr:pollen-specific protein SF3 [Lingula anatina]|eukprot:XP_013397523.1 pollen-specific protein SF3 [Lingula anatina]